MVGNRPLSYAKAYRISTYDDLVRQIAHLSYLNKDYLLFFRGQDRDYLNKVGASTFYPSIYRGDRVTRSEISNKFQFLSKTSDKLCEVLQNQNVEGCKDVKRRKLIQWSILQHYEICPTPLLDLTHSIRVACSFAYLSSQKNDPFVFAFGMPYTTNRISVNSEHDLVNVRLLSICPPDALRPYFQEGYMAGTDEITTEYDSKDELDFNNRLVAKFQLVRGKFFESFAPIPKSSLYPNNDNFSTICKDLLGEIYDPVREQEFDNKVEPAALGRFLQEWADLESLIFTKARIEGKYYSINRAINALNKKSYLTNYLFEELDRTRQLRNRVAHDPNNVKYGEIVEGLKQIKLIKDSIED